MLSDKLMSSDRKITLTHKIKEITDPDSAKLAKLRTPSDNKNGNKNKLFMVPVNEF